VNAGELLEAAHSFPFSSLEDRLGNGGLVVVAPHPDDESLACGGLIAEACAQGRSVRVVFVSDGTGSHPNSKKYPESRLRDLREREALEAIFELGLNPVDAVFLRFRDRFVRGEGPLAEESIAIILDCIRQVGAEALFVTWRYDPHCDHQASYSLARSAQRNLSGVRLFEYTVWGSALPPTTPIGKLSEGFRIQIDRWKEKKRRAIAAHRSQTTALIDDDPNGFRLGEKDLARFRHPYEFFFESAEWPDRRRA
jgi:LmbE family N-acetylglucosaminyl deacetylase